MLGEGGLALAGAKLAARGNTGVELHTDKVPTCDEDMSALEIIASDSQDRMLAVVTPENLEEVLNILTEYNTPHAVIGQVTDEGLLQADFQSQIGLKSACLRGQHRWSGWKSLLIKLTCCFPC
jgi:phosphoribosylformylglycinamidine (FGAM) synthase-like enzyme